MSAKPMKCLMFRCGEPQVPGKSGYCLTHAEAVEERKSQHAQCAIDGCGNPKISEILPFCIECSNEIDAGTKKNPITEAREAEEAKFVDEDGEDVNGVPTHPGIRREAKRLWERQRAKEWLDKYLAEEHEPLDSWVIDRDELDTLEEPASIIPGVLYTDAYALLVGRKASYKSFVALSWVLSVVTGLDWNGKPTAAPEGRPNVLYMAGEGVFGIRKRVEAWEKHHGVKVNSGPGKFRLLRRAVNLFKGNGIVDEFVRLIEEGQYGIVVIDTLRLVASGADGNSTDMGTVVDNIKRLVEATHGGCVIVVAHTTKDDVDTRGFSGIEDDADIVWHAKRDEKMKTARQTNLVNRKMKDSADGAKILLRMESVDLGTNPDGTVRDSLVATFPDPLTVAKPTMSNRQAIVETIRNSFRLTGATKADVKNNVKEVTGIEVSKATVYRLMDEMTEKGELTNKGLRYFLPSAAGEGESAGVSPEDQQ